MPEQEELRRQLQEARDRYMDLYRQLVQQQAPAALVVAPALAACSVGEVCHGGTF